MKKRMKWYRRRAVLKGVGGRGFVYEKGATSVMVAECSTTVIGDGAVRADRASQYGWKCFWGKDHGRRGPWTLHKTASSAKEALRIGKELRAELDALEALGA